MLNNVKSASGGKKTFLLLTVILFVSAAAYSQPKAVKDAFAAKFPNAENVKWDKENSREYEAEFTLNLLQMSANFLKDGTWLETETDIGVDYLPQAIKDYVKTNYPDGRIVDASKIEKPGNVISYEIDIETKGKKMEVAFDEKGNIIK